MHVRQNQWAALDDATRARYLQAPAEEEVAIAPLAVSSTSSASAPSFASMAPPAVAEAFAQARLESHMVVADALVEEAERLGARPAFESASLFYVSRS